MQIFTIVAGLDDLASAVHVAPNDTIATLLQKVQSNLKSLNMPHQCTGAFSIVHTRKEGLTEEDPDNIALEHSDPEVTAKYCTPAAQLDPKKMVRFYFGTRVEPRTASILLTWPAESLARIKREREDAQTALMERITAYRAKGKTRPLPMHVLAAPVMGMSTERTTNEPRPVSEGEIEATVATVVTAPSSWHWLASCLPGLAACSRWAQAAVVACHDANKKKHD